MSVEVWLSAAVVNTWLRDTGMVVLRSTILVITPPRVSIPRDSGRNVQKDNVLYFADQHAALDGGTDGHAFIRVDALVWFFAGQFLDSFLNGGIRVEPPTRMTLSMSPAERPASDMCLTRWAHGFFNQVCGQFVKFGTRQGQIHVLWLTVAVHGDKGQVEVGRGNGGQFHLGFFSGFFQALHSGFIAVRSIPCLVFEVQQLAQSMIFLSKSSPPRRLLPLVAKTSKMPSPISSRDTSKVPPPRSKTRIF